MLVINKHVSSLRFYWWPQINHMNQTQTKLIQNQNMVKTMVYQFLAYSDRFGKKKRVLEQANSIVVLDK